MVLQGFRRGKERAQKIGISKIGRLQLNQRHRDLVSHAGKVLAFNRHVFIQDNFDGFALHGSD